MQQEFDDLWDGASAERVLADTWLISYGGATSYLVCADGDAMMIDSGNPVAGLRAYAESVCGVPVTRVVNTHGHIDHTGGNLEFDEILISPEAEFVMREYYEREGLADGLDQVRIISLKEGDVIRVGRDRALEVFPMGVHSPGSIALLDRTDRVLFTGDDVMGRAAMLIWRCPDPQGSLLLYAIGLSKLMAHRLDFDWVACGHAKELQEGDLIERFLELTLSALHGDYTDREERHPGRQGFPDPEFKKEAWGRDVHINFDERYMWDYTVYSHVEGS